LSFWSGKGLRFFDLVEGDGAVDWEKRGGERDSPGGGKQEKKGKMRQHCTILCN